MNLRELDQMIRLVKADYDQTRSKTDLRLLLFYRRKKKELVTSIKQAVNQKLATM